MSFHDGRNSATAHGLTNTLESNSCHIVGRKGKSKHYTVVFYDQSLKKKTKDMCHTQINLWYIYVPETLKGLKV